jgi:lysozyme
MSDAAEKIIRAAEGCTRKVIKDTRGILTIAIGAVVDPRIASSAGLCDAAIEAQFANDSAAARARAAAIPGVAALNDVRRGVLVSMCFQLGELEWPQFRAALARGDLVGAQAAGLDSDWARETPTRAKWELAMLVSGQLTPYPV